MIEPSTWRTADDWSGQSIDIRGRTMELLEGRQLGDAWEFGSDLSVSHLLAWLESQSIDAALASGLSGM